MCLRREGPGYLKKLLVCFLFGYNLPSLALLKKLLIFIECLLCDQNYIN